MKVYLSKSNLCTQKRIAQARTALHLDKRVDIIEYVGGGYSNQPLLASDVLFVLKPDDVKGKTVKVGRGQYEQVKAFMEAKPWAQIFVITDLDQECTDMDYRNVISVSKSDREDWVQDYGVLGLGAQHDYIDEDTPSLIVRVDPPKSLNPCTELPLTEPLKAPKMLVLDSSPKPIIFKQPFPKPKLMFACAKRLGLI